MYVESPFASMYLLESFHNLRCELRYEEFRWDRTQSKWSNLFLCRASIYFAPFGVLPWHYLHLQPYALHGLNVVARNVLRV
jgi:hypothetical protein